MKIYRKSKRFIRSLFQVCADAHYYHYILIAAVVASVALTFIHYRLSLVRALQTFVDVFDSLKIYIEVMLSPDMELPEGTIARITLLPDVDIQGVIPFDLKELERKLHDMWECAIDKRFMIAYAKWVINKSYYILFYGLTLVELLLALYLVAEPFIFDERTDHGQDSPALTAWKKGPETVYLSVKRWVLSFYHFFNESPYKWILAVVWFVNFNLVAITAELIAFYFYFVATFEISAVSVQLVRLLIDGLIAYFTTPAIVWTVIAYIVFDRLRRKRGYEVLRRNEASNCEFLKNLPVVSMILGTMGTGKTTMLTDAGLSQQNVFREKAKDFLFQADLKFPDFPWQKFEDALQGAIDHHKMAYVMKSAVEDQTVFDQSWYLFTPDEWRRGLHKQDRGIWSLSSCRSFIARRRKIYDADPVPHNLFGYDLARHSATYQDGLIVTDLFDVLEEYAQLYYLYATRSPLLVSNYSVRSDAVLQDNGNFPEWNMDFFERDPEEATENSQNAHIVDFDTLRLGNLVDPDNPRKGSFEFGTVLLSEIGKERGNSLENRGQKKTDEKANAVNDGFNSRLKMSRHAAVIANYPFIKIFTDEQRAESWGADARDLCKLVKIKERSDMRVAMPFFAVEGLLYELLYPAYKDFYYRLRFTRGDNTLFGYLLKKVFCTFYNHYLKIVNTFGYSVLTIDLQDGTTDGDGEGELFEYYLSHKKIYSNRFSTDCYADLFAEASLRASVGLDDYDQYQTTRAAWNEMERQNSYFVRDMAKQFMENNADDKR